MTADENTAARKRCRWVLAGGALLAAVVLSWWFGASAVSAEEDLSDVAAEAVDETDELDDATAAGSTALGNGATPPVVGEALLGELAAAHRHVHEAMSANRTPILVPVLDATLPPVLAPVVRPLGTTVDAVVAPVVAPVTESVVTPIVDGVSDSVVAPLQSAVTPIVTAVVDSVAVPPVVGAPTATAASPSVTADDQAVVAGADASAEMVHEAEVALRKGSHESSRRSAAEEQPVPGGGQPAPAGHDQTDEAPESSSRAPHSSGRTAPSASHGDQVERAQRGLLTPRAIAPAAVRATAAQTRATVAGASQNSGSRPAFTPD